MVVKGGCYPSELFIDRKWKRSMGKKIKIKAAVQNKDAEIIIKQHPHWTYRIEGRLNRGVGNLVLTNRRLLFLHKIDSSPEVSASIKKLADAPIETVLDHALALHKNSFQMPLSSITRVGIGAYLRFPFPYFNLKVYFRRAKKQASTTVNFQFRREKNAILLHPQLLEDLGWRRTINRVLKETARLNKK
jgi:hypothetical protein